MNLLIRKSILSLSLVIFCFFCFSLRYPNTGIKVKVVPESEITIYFDMPFANGADLVSIMLNRSKHIIIQNFNKIPADSVWPLKKHGFSMIPMSYPQLFWKQ